MSTTAPCSSAGCCGSSAPLAVITASIGSGARPSRPRSSANSPAAGGCAFSGVQSALGEPCSVPEPTSTQSAAARSSPMTNRSVSLSPLISRFERGSERMATMPSSVSTKFAYRSGGSTPNGAAVQRLELLRKVEGRQALGLVQELERVHERTSARKSWRSAGSSV